MRPLCDELRLVESCLPLEKKASLVTNLIVAPIVVASIDAAKYCSSSTNITAGVVEAEVIVIVFKSSASFYVSSQYVVADVPLSLALVSCWHFGHRVREKQKYILAAVLRNGPS